MKYCLIGGDALENLKKLPDDFFRACISSPPYWRQRNYEVEGQIGQETTPDQYVDILVNVFREVRRVLTKDGTFWLNLGDSYYSAPTGSRGNYTGKKYGFGKNHKTSEAALKRPDKTIKGIDSKNIVGIPWRVALSLQKDGWILRQDIVWEKINTMPESVKDRFTRAHEYIFLLTKSNRYYFDHKAVQEPQAVSSLARQKRGVSNNHKNSNGAPGQTPHSLAEPRPYDKNREVSLFRNKRSVWSCSVSKFKGAHSATFSEKLIEPCILAGSAENDWILDPFSGASTTGIVSLKNNRNYVGIELNKDFIEISRKRLEQIDPIFLEEIGEEKLNDPKNR